MGHREEGSQATSCHMEPEARLECPQAGFHQGGRWRLTSTNGCPGQFDAEGVLLEDGPSHPVPPGGDIG